MQAINKYITWLMVISGLITGSMIFGLFWPQLAVESIFGVAIQGQPELIIARSWSALIGLIGVMLIYGAFNESNRNFSIFVAITSKIIFVSLLLFFGQEFLNKAAATIILDSVIIALFGLYLISDLKNRRA
mgnify:CR=1 FL=1